VIQTPTESRIETDLSSPIPADLGDLIGPTTNTDRSLDPLECIREIASAPTLAWAEDRWRRSRLEHERLLLLARRRGGISAEAAALAWEIQDNPALASREGRVLRRQVFEFLTSVMLAAAGTSRDDAPTAARPNAPAAPKAKAAAKKIGRPRKSKRPYR
jgi:hypothetical protein